LDSWNTFAGQGVSRLSVGLEGTKDLIADLEQALNICSPILSVNN